MHLRAQAINASICYTNARRRLIVNSCALARGDAVLASNVNIRNGFDLEKQHEESWLRFPPQECVVERRDIDLIRCAVKNTPS